MKVRYGKLLTHQREQLVADYQRRRMNVHSNVWYIMAYRKWTWDFERFMCRGLGSTEAIPLDRRSTVAHETPNVQQSGVAHGSARHGAVTRVD